MSGTLPAETAPATRETLADIFVVDADVHLHEDPAELAEYADPPWDTALREIAKVEERYLDLPAMSPRAEFRIPWPGGTNRPQVVSSPDAMRRELDDLHVNVAILFPDHLLSLAMVREPAFAVALARSYNDWLADRWLRREPTLKGSIVIPPQDPAAGRGRDPQARRQPELRLRVPPGAPGSSSSTGMSSTTRSTRRPRRPACRS